MPHYSLQQLKNFTNEIFRYVEYRIQNHELHITLNRPEKMNAMNPQFIREIAFLLDYARAENSIWIVVVRA
ncbi:MAG: enoyl-CoA hydratase, partial [Cytophagales bacterium]|nr:enoyl-CoA hydratase [Cytophagales bacterium]